MSALQRPALLVGIDTEGDDQWRAASRRRQTFENLYALEKLHGFFARFHVRPTYFVTYPVACDARSVDVLERLMRRGDCEIGAHHHVWETPPFEASDVDRHPYALSLSRERFARQLEALTHAISNALGTRPVSYRSGRFGFSAAHVPLLEAQHYQVDSSVVPMFYEAHKKGPDFVGAQLRPYYLSYDDPSRSGTSSLLELPVSAALNRRMPQWLASRYGRAPWPYTTKRLLRLARIARVRWLRPSFGSAEDMIGLGRQLAADGVGLLNLFFHSSEAIVGASPYNKTEGELSAFFDRLGRFFRVATDELGAVPMTFSEFQRSFVSAPFDRPRPGRDA